MLKTPANSPTNRYLSGMAYDMARREVVLFGGRDSTNRNDTWVWDGVNWTQKSPLNSPTPRQVLAMTYGLSDVEEAAHGTNPLLVDSESDGLSDWMEVDIGTDPLSPDTDGDVVSDWDEYRVGSDPQDPSVTTGPTPEISAISPASAPAGQSVTLNVDGGGFFTGVSIVNVAGQAVPTTFVNRGQLQAIVSPSALCAPGPCTVTVTNPAPGGGVSNTATLMVTAGATAGSGGGVLRLPPSGSPARLNGTAGRPSPTVAQTTGELPPVSVAPQSGAVTADNGGAGNAVSAELFVSMGQSWAVSRSGWEAVASDTETAVLQRTAAIDLRAATHASLTLQSRLSTRTSWAEVQTRTEGSGWQTLSVVQPLDDWESIDIDLSDLLGEFIEIRFVFQAVAPADGAEPDSWQVDDLRVDVTVPKSLP